MLILIPLKAQNHYEELRYCLRSIEKFYPDADILIVGAKPIWITKVRHMAHGDHPDPFYRARNIYTKILSAFKYHNELLFFNDDFIIQAKVDYLHHKGRMIDNINSRDPHSTYRNQLQNTVDQFGDVYDYDTHCPIIYHKEMFEKLSILDWNKRNGYGIKTSYVYMNGLKGTYYPDMKCRLTIPDVTGRLYFCVDDDCNLTPLQKLFPDKSKFELY